MTTTLGVPIPHRPGGARLSAARLHVLPSGVEGALVLAALFFAVWLILAADLFGKGHMYAAMFMAGVGGPAGSLVLGLIGSSLAGFLIGALVAISYNLLPFVARR